MRLTTPDLAARPRRRPPGDRDLRTPAQRLHTVVEARDPADEPVARVTIAAVAVLLLFTAAFDLRRIFAMQRFGRRARHPG